MAWTLIMVEVRPRSKTGRVYCRKIADFKKDTLYPIIEATVSEDANVVTDEYRVMINLKKNSPRPNSGKAIQVKVSQSFINK